jgi:hypothetical protein
VRIPTPLPPGAPLLTALALSPPYPRARPSTEAASRRGSASKFATPTRCASALRTSTATSIAARSCLAGAAREHGSAYANAAPTRWAIAHCTSASTVTSAAARSPKQEQPGGTGVRLHTLLPLGALVLAAPARALSPPRLHARQSRSSPGGRECVYQRHSHSSVRQCSSH